MSVDKDKPILSSKTLPGKIVEGTALTATGAAVVTLWGAYKVGEYAWKLGKTGASWAAERGKAGWDEVTGKNNATLTSEALDRMTMHIDHLAERLDALAALALEQEARIAKMQAIIEAMDDEDDE